MGGKEVILKAVECVVPIYSIACYKWPKKLCFDLNNATARFGQRKDESRVHLRSWES